MVVWEILQTFKTKIGEDELTCEEHKFSDGWFNHQLELYYTLYTSYHLMPTLLETNISHTEALFEDYFPSPQLGYMISLQGNT